MYFHEVNNSKWGVDSYIKISDIKNLNDLLYLYKKIPNYTSGMFFLMKGDIAPIYEDKRNINGGVWTFKLSKKHCDIFWKELCILFCQNKITKDGKNDNIINGMSISPKISNIIFKLWISKNSDINILRNDINNLHIKEALYRSHIKNK
tara:strand:+ start:1155 stop:1601 length:447 start_codon:yes stop_codon:yes gene_type:complete